MGVYLQSFFSCVKIGAFTIGGGYAMIPLIEREFVEKRGWIDKEDFVDILALAQSAPGILAINVAIFVGYRLKGVKGSIVTTLGTALPSFLIILAIALFFSNFKDNHYVQSVFKGIRPAVVALIAVPVFNMAKTAKVNRYTAIIPIAAALLIWQLQVSPILIIVVAAAAGFVYGRIKQKR